MAAVVCHGRSCAKLSSKPIRPGKRALFLRSGMYHAARNAAEAMLTYGW